MDLKLLAPLRVLYIEDEEPTRQNAVEYLSRYFKEVYEASNGIEGLNIYRNKQPDIIISDIKMPKLNGLEFASLIRQEDKKTPIIILTAYTDKDYLIRAVELQLIKYLVKPVEPFKLKEALFMAYKSLDSNRINILTLAKDAHYDSFNKVVVISGKVIKLTKNEMLFFDYLAQNSQRAVSYSEIENIIAPESGISKDALRALVYALRKKLSNPKPEYDFIENLSGVGYRLKIEV